MKVCAVTTWPPHRDGIAYYSWKLYSEIGKHAKVTVIANHVPYLLSQTNATASLDVQREWKRGSPLVFFRTFRATVRNRCDVVHVQHGWLLYGNAWVSSMFPLLLLLLRLSKKPVVTTVHSVIRRDAANKSFPRSPIMRMFLPQAVLAITKLIGLFSHEIIVHNALMKRLLVSDYRLDRNKIVVIPHGVDRAETAERVQPVSGRIMFFGHLRPTKGVEYLLQAFRLLLEKNQGAGLLLVGSPHAHDKLDYVSKLQRLIDNLAISHRVKIESFVPEKRLSELIHSSQIIVLPYLDDGFIEASGALARMMDYGRPVICSNIPKFRAEFADRTRCTMINPKDMKALAETLDSFLNDPRLREEKADLLEEVAETRYWNLIAERHIALYKKCLFR